MTNSPENQNRGEITKWQEIEIFQIEPFRIEAVHAISGLCYSSWNEFARSTCRGTIKGKDFDMNKRFFVGFL